MRCAKFIARKQWFAAGADDMMIRVFNYNTGERVAAFEGHVRGSRLREREESAHGLSLEPRDAGAAPARRRRRRRCRRR